MNIYNLIIKTLQKLSQSRILPPVFLQYKRSCLDSVWNNNDPQLFDEISISPASRDIDFSVIMPLYNSSSFMGKVIPVLLNQKTKYTYEIILVDDGSKDDTLGLAKEYKDKHPNVVQVIHKENGGISNARNTGLKASKGKYVGFMDHDDLVDDNYVESLMECAYKNNADVVKCEIIVRDIEDNILEDIQTIDENVSPNDYESLLKYDGYIWAGAIKRELFENLRFPKSYWYEDMMTRFLVYSRANKIANTTRTKYYKLEHQNNASKVVWSSKQYKSLEQLYLLEHLVENMNRFNVNFTPFLYKSLLSEASGTTAYRVNSLDSKIKKQVFLALRELVLKYINDDLYRTLDDKEKTVFRIFKEKQFYNWLLLKYM